MKKTENLSEKEKTAKLAGSAFYKTRKTPKSQMVMLKILQANRLDNLRKANKIAALAYFAKPDSKDLDINYDIVEILYSISNAFISTKKTTHYYQKFGYPIYPISWGFQLTLKTYERYIVPWIKDYNRYPFFCSSYENYLHKETWVSCPYCKEVILITKKTTEANTIKQVKEKFKESLSEAKEILIDEKEIEKRRYGTSPYSTGFYYKPPYWKASYVKCPKCKEKLRVYFKFYEGSDAKWYDPVKPPEFETKEPIIENKEYYDPVVEVKKFAEESHYLTHKGYNQLINSFLDWAEPKINNIEFEILKLVDEDTLKKYFDDYIDQKPDKGEDQP